MSGEKTTRIRELNDHFRKTGEKGRLLMTRGVNELDSDVVTKIVVAVRTFDDFTPDNDPHGEHDFGAFEAETHKLFWKIDYYAADMIHGSPDASNPEVTTRLLTIMLREEY